MGYVDKDLFGGLLGKSMSGLAITQPLAMQLQVATGSVTSDGTTYTLAEAQSHTFTSDATDQKVCFVALVDNGTTTNVWFDEYVDTGSNTRATIPAGYKLVQALAWFTIAAAETDLGGSAINRRILI